jgi:mannose-P-dolichol utilization defect 1
MGYGWIEIVGVIAGILGLAVAIPQLLKVLKAKSHVGVSITTWMLMMLNYSVWLGFSLRMDSPSQLWANILAAGLTAVLVYVLLKEHWSKTVTPLLVILFSIILSVGVIMISPVWLMDVVLTAFIFARVPQILSSFKSWRIGRHTNVSLLAYLLMALSSVGWIVYGAVTGLYMNVISSSVGLFFSVLVVVFELLAERKYVKTLRVV